MNGGPQARVSSPVFERSTLMTSAPRSASTCPAQGPARIRASSSTRTPANGPGMDNSLDVLRGNAANGALCAAWNRLCLGLPVNRDDGTPCHHIVRRGEEQDRGGDLLDLRPGGEIRLWHRFPVRRRVHDRGRDGIHKNAILHDLLG